MHQRSMVTNRHVVVLASSNVETKRCRVSHSTDSLYLRVGGSNPFAGNFDLSRCGGWARSLTDCTLICTRVCISILTWMQRSIVCSIDRDAAEFV